MVRRRIKWVVSTTHEAELGLLDGVVFFDLSQSGCVWVLIPQFYDFGRGCGRTPMTFISRLGAKRHATKLMREWLRSL